MGAYQHVLLSHFPHLCQEGPGQSFAAHSSAAAISILDGTDQDGRLQGDLRAPGWPSPVFFTRCAMYRNPLALIALLALLILLAGRGQAEPPASEVKDYTKPDLEKLGIKPVRPRQDPKTGFIVGGKNTTARILVPLAGVWLLPSVDQRHGDGVRFLDLPGAEQVLQFASVDVVHHPDGDGRNAERLLAESEIPFGDGVIDVGPVLPVVRPRVRCGLYGCHPRSVKGPAQRLAVSVSRCAVSRAFSLTSLADVIPSFPIRIFILEK
jgi:hypothetical protein